MRFKHTHANSVWNSQGNFGIHLQDQEVVADSIHPAIDNNRAAINNCKYLPGSDIHLPDDLI